MIENLNLFRVRVIQPEPIVAGSSKNKISFLKEIIEHSYPCDLIIAPYGVISGCSKNQSISSLTPFKEKVNKDLLEINNSYQADTPIIINDITGLYYLDYTHKGPTRITNGRVRLGDKATIRFVEDDKDCMKSSIQELSEDLIVFYEPSTVNYPIAVTKVNNNSALMLFNNSNTGVPFFSTNGSFNCPDKSMLKSSLIYFDINPKYYDPKELLDNHEYIKIPIKNWWTVGEKTHLNFYHPVLSNIVSYNPNYCRWIFEQQVSGTVEKLRHLGKDTKCFIGVSGGSDSTLSLLVTYSAYKELGWNIKNIFGVSMPCFGTTERTRNNAKQLIEKLGITYREINIEKSVTAFLNDLGHPLDNTNVTYENAQARIRMMILFGLSNDLGGIVIGTGDLSEHWLGWCTFGGDDLAGYNPNCKVLKTTVLQIIKYLCSEDEDDGEGTCTFTNVLDILLDIIDTPISPELVKGGSMNQKTEDILGPYILHDIFITGLCLGWDEIKIKEFAKIYTGLSEDIIDKTYITNITRFSKSQFKRNINIPGPNVDFLESDILNNINMPTDFEL